MNLKQPQVVVKGENTVYKVDNINWGLRTVHFWKEVDGALQIVEYSFEDVDMIK